MQNSALWNRYNELLEFCNNPDGDLTEERARKMELYSKIALGFEAALEGRVRSLADAIKDLGLN